MGVNLIQMLVMLNDNMIKLDACRLFFLGKSVSADQSTSREIANFVG